MVTQQKARSAAAIAELATAIYKESLRGKLLISLGKMLANTPIKNVLLAILFVAFIACDAHASEERITLSGSSTLAPLASEIAQRFEEMHPEFRIDVQTGGSSRGIADAIRGLSDIGMSSRALYDEEKRDITTHRIAMDGVAFVVHANNPLKQISRKQAQQLYTGKIRNWEQLGGPDATITVIDRAKGRSENTLVRKFLALKPTDVHANVVAGENQQCIKLLLGNEHAIVYLSVGTAEFEIGRGAPLRLLSLEGIEASSKSVRSKVYPIVRPLVLITSAQIRPATRKFLDFALSPQVSDLVKGQAFVPLHQ